MTDILKFAYRNHRGELAERQVRPDGLTFGTTPWHPRQQWLLWAHDLERQADRQFALVDVLGFGEAGTKRLALRQALEQRLARKVRADCPQWVADVELLRLALEALGGGDDV